MVKLKSLPFLAIWAILAVMLISIVANQQWLRFKPNERGVIKWDVISYYSYLPATFIYGDVSLGFLDDPAFNNDNKFWPVQLENGNRLIQTSMGLSILYSPFFFMAHLLTHITGGEADGYSSLYEIFLMLSSIFYVMMGLLVLRRLLLKYYSPKATAIALVLVGLGTNLFYYTIHEGPMSHAYNFALITLFLYLVVQWYGQPTWGRSILIGLVYGLIVLVRPSNIVAGILFLGWGITSFSKLKQQPGFLLKHYQHILLMGVMFLLPWIPQMLYWKTVTGAWLYNSYSQTGSSFYFGSPHIFHLLFSFRKGWYLYTPVMLVATAGLFFLGRKCKGGLWPISFYLAVQIYVLASWWSWWNGGSFGLRSFVDIYGVMALPLAALVEAALKARRELRLPTLAFLCFLLYMNQFQILQYAKGYIHHTGMTREAYRLNFLSFRPDGSCWLMLSMPDASLARLGISVTYYTGDDYAELKAMEREAGVHMIQGEVEADQKLMKEISKHSRRSGIPNEEAIEMVVERVYDQKISW